MRQAIVLTALILGCMSPAGAAPSLPGAPLTYGPPASVPPPRSDHGFSLLRSEIIELRERALALQASDGGTLTTEHRDFIQTRIDAAYRRYREARR